MSKDFKVICKVLCISYRGNEEAYSGDYISVNT